MSADATAAITVIPFCPCMHKPDYKGGMPMGEPTLAWKADEYEVLSTEAVYVAVAEHRRVCELQPDLVERFAESNEAHPARPLAESDGAPA